MSGPTRRDILKGAATGAAALTFAGTVSGANGESQYVITAKNSKVTQRLKKEGFELVRELADGDVLVVTGSTNPGSVKGVGEAVENLKFRLERPPVDIDDGDGDKPEDLTEDETLYPLQWDKQTTEAATAHETSTGDGASVAIIDSGVDVDHPDLEPNISPGGLFRLGADPNTIPGDTGVYLAQKDPAGIPVRVPTVPVPELEGVTDADGLTVGYKPENFTTTTDRRVDDDVDGHGSHVAGIAAASVGEAVTPRNTGIAGMAPDATIISHRVFYWIKEEVTYEKDTDDDDEPEEVTETLVNQFTTFADILTAIDFAANTLGVDAMNLSIGTPPLPPQVNAAGIRQTTNLVVRDAVNAGSVVVVSAGNSNTELNKGGVFTLPNSVPGTMSIAATGPNDKRSFYSNYGNNEVSVGAPGGGYETIAKTLSTNEDEVEWPFPLNLVLSTVPPDIYGAAYAYFAGTSMAAPQVAGAAALAATANPELSTTQIERVIEQGAKRATGQEKEDVGAGVLNAAGTVAEADK